MNKNECLRFSAYNYLRRLNSDFHLHVTTIISKIVFHREETRNVQFTKTIYNT